MLSVYELDYKHDNHPLEWLEEQVIDREKQLPMAVPQKQLPVEHVDNMTALGPCASNVYMVSPWGSFIPNTIAFQGHDLLQRREDIKDAIEIASGVAKVKEEIRRRREMASSWVELDRIEGIPMFYYQLDGDSVVHFKPFARIYNIQCTQYICALDGNGIWKISWDTVRKKKREIYVRDADLSEKKLKSLMIKRGVNVLAKQMKELV